MTSPYGLPIGAACLIHTFAAFAPAAPAPTTATAVAASPRELWARFEQNAPPFEFVIRTDEIVASETDRRQRLRRIEVRFCSQVVDGHRMDHTAVIFIPADPPARQTPERRGRVVIVGQRLGDAAMLYNYGDPIATRTGYPTMVLPVPGAYDGLDGEGRWMQLCRARTQATRDPFYHNYFRLAVPYLRAIQVFSRVLGENEIRAIIGGHSKRATSAFTAAPIDPTHIVGLVYMGNETTFSLPGTDYLRAVNIAHTQRHVNCPVLYLGATNEDGYEMFNINRIQAVMQRPWTIEYIPNYRHAPASEVQFLDWQMWVAHVFDDRPLARISDLSWEETSQGTVFRARVRTPNRIIQVKFWYVYCDDVPYWRDLVWYPVYPTPKGDDLYEAFVDGILPDAWLVEVKDTAMGFPGYLSSLPQNITNKPTKERVSHGWKSRHWRPKTPGACLPSTRPARAGVAETFPAGHWETVEAPEDYGWSSTKLAEARAYADSIGSAAVMIVHHGRLISQWGQTGKRYNVHSIRKSLLSALYGIHVAAGTIRLDETLEALGIDDNEPSLTPVEKQATVLDLMKARSGVYHPAAYETEAMKAARPARHSHAPGTFWYYNNWDFNALGTIFRSRTGASIGSEFQKRIAEPIQMEDFRVADVTLEPSFDSIHPAYPFRMTARDLARFGLLFLRQGRWRDRQVIPLDWIARSLRPYSVVRDENGHIRSSYGLMWWASLQGRHLEGVDLPPGSFSARGAGAHYLLVVPEHDLVIVHRVDTDDATAPRVGRDQFGGLVRRILDAMPTGEPRVASTQPEPRRWLPEALDELVPRLMQRHRVPGVSIVGIEDRRISWERQYGVRAASSARPVDSQTVFEACSMSKLPFAYVALKLAEEGQLDLDRPLVEYLDKPYLPDEPQHARITARMVLSHTTGLPNWREGGWRGGGPLRLVHEPGTRFTYSGEGFLYLQRVIEHITGRPLESLIRATLFEPLGITTSSYVWQDRYESTAAAGHDAEGRVRPDRPLYRDANAAFSLYCTPAEYAAFLVEILKRDRSAAHSLSDAALGEMLTRITRAEGRQPVARSGIRAPGDVYWGLGWAIDATSSGDRAYHSGSNGTGFRCYCEFDRQRGSGLVIMTNAVGGEALWRDVLASVGEP